MANQQYPNPFGGNPPPPPPPPVPPQGFAAFSAAPNFIALSTNPNPLNMLPTSFGSTGHNNSRGGGRGGGWEGVVDLGVVFGCKALFLLLALNLHFRFQQPFVHVVGGVVVLLLHSLKGVEIFVYHGVPVVDERFEEVVEGGVVVVSGGFDSFVEVVARC